MSYFEPQVLTNFALNLNFKNMHQLIVPIVDWSNGILMIGVFGLVVIALIAILISLMNSGKKG